MVILMALPVVPIIGRPNVGKSTLFNRLAGRRISIVDAQAGVTRDRVSTTTEAGDRHFELVDTGGYGVEDLDALGPQIEQQIRYARDRADVVLFLVDAQSGPTPLDHQLAQLLRREEKSVILVANKVDNEKLLMSASEFLTLGFDEMVCISALRGDGINDLLEAVARHLASAQAAPPDPVMKLALVGPRNAGKSTFINSLAGEDRVIVSEIPGTTRDAVDVRFELGGESFLAIDTAGIRKKSKIRDSIEFYGLARAERSIRRADVILLVIDATEKVGQVTKKLAGYIVEHYKPCVIVVNKWDLAVGKADIDQYGEYLGKTLPGLSICPISLVCATDAVNVTDTVKVAWNLFKQSIIRVPTAKLNAAIEEIRKLRPPRASRAKRHPKVYYATQVDVRPPTIVVFVNDKEAFSGEYQRYVVNRLHEMLPFSEIPIRLIVRQRNT